MPSKFYNNISFLTAIVFCTFFVTISFCMRPSTDDLALFCTLRDKGFPASLQYNFYSFNFRHLPLVWVNSIFSIQDISNVYQWIVPLSHLAMLGLFLFSLMKVIGFFAAYYFNKDLTGKESFILASMLLALFFFSTSQSIEIWTYMAVYACYLYPVIAAFAALPIIPAPKNNTIRTVLLLVFSFWAGSGMELISMILICTITAVLSVRIKQAGMKNFLKEIQNRKLVLAFSAVAVSFLLVLIAPGTHQRSVVEDELAAYRHTGSLFNVIANLFSSYSGSKLIFICLLCFCFFSVGRTWPAEPDKIRHRDLRRLIFQTVTLLLLAFVLTLGVSLRIFEGGLPDRCWFPLNILFALILCFSSLYFGSKAKKIARTYLPAISSAFLLAAIIGYGCIQIPTAAKFARKFDERISILQSYHGKVTLDLEPLPSSGIIVASEISPDSLHNELFEAAYGLKFHVRLKRAY